MPRTGKSSPKVTVRAVANAEGAMDVKFHAMSCGTPTRALADLMEGGKGEVTLPIPADLIEHSKGTVLFESAMHPDCFRT
jgi:hypothetical protein